jgi:hypothetical protein
MVALIQLIPSIATTYLTNIEEKYKKASTAKKEFISAVKFTQRSSDDYVDEANPGGAVCSTYDELKAEFEKEGAFEEWKEDKLGFKPNVKILEGADIDDGMKLIKTISSKVITRIYGANGTNSTSKQFEARRKAIQLRIDNRKRVLEKANALRKAICEYLEALKPKQEEVDKVYAKAYWRSMPKDFQKKVYSAVTKTTDPIYNLVIKPVYHSFDDSELGLVDPNGAPIMFTRRMIAYHLLQELGFTENTRKQVTKVDSSVAAVGAVAGVVNASANKKTIPEPDLSSFDCAGEKSLANDDYWGDYVASLSGVPPIEKNSLTVGGALRGALTSSLNDIKDSIYGLKNMREEIATWGEGKQGRILFATDGTTYQMENNSFNEVVGIQPNIPPFLSEESEGLEDKQKKKLAAFVATLRTELGKI